VSRTDGDGQRPTGPDWPPGLSHVRAATPLPGGFICTVQRATLVDGRDVVVKRCPYPAELEADGLRALADAGAPTPAVLGVARRVLVLEHVSGVGDAAELGRVIARMHRSTGPRYGWHQDNVGGLTTQHNAWCDDWPTFLVERRVLPHLPDPRVPRTIARRIERACAGPLPALLPRHPPASLTHGDLWSGNVVGRAWLVDPAVSYTDRELEVAFMRRPGNLPARTLAAYLEAWPLERGYEERLPALLLHKLLNNVRHFGDRLVPQVEQVLDHYGW
jgi:fructosamine-3-kinase